MNGERRIKVSVVVPVYNQERYLRKCVDSLINQTLTDIEIILVDDGSDDLCPLICDNLALMDFRIKVIHQYNSGPGFARNSGIECAHGEYIAFVDADDYIASDALEIAYEVAKLNDADEVRYIFKEIVDGDEDSINRNGVPSQELIIADSISEKLGPYLSCVSGMNDRNGKIVRLTGSACTAIYRLKVINDSSVRFCSGKDFISEDYIFNIEYMLACRKVVFLDQILYFYRKNLNSATRIFKEDRFQKAIVFTAKLKELLYRIKYPHEDLVIMGYLINFVRSYYRNLYNSADIPLSRKKKIFGDVNRHPIMRDIFEKYPSSKLPLGQRMVFVCGAKNMFYCCRALFFFRNVIFSWRK